VSKAIWKDLKNNLRTFQTTTILDSRERLLSNCSVKKQLLFAFVLFGKNKRCNYPNVLSITPLFLVIRTNNKHLCKTAPAARLFQPIIWKSGWASDQLTPAVSLLLQWQKKLNGILSFAICFFVDSIKSAIKKLTETQTLLNLYATCFLGSINFVHFLFRKFCPLSSVTTWITHVRQLQKFLKIKQIENKK